MDYHYYNGVLYHHGVKGQKWGVRRYQNPDGTLTEKGRMHYSYDIKGAKENYKDAKRYVSAVKRGKLGEALRTGKVKNLPERKNQTVLKVGPEYAKQHKKEAIRNAKDYAISKKAAINIEKAKKRIDGKKSIQGRKFVSKTERIMRSTYEQLGVSGSDLEIAVNIGKRYMAAAAAGGFAAGYATGAGAGGAH